MSFLINEESMLRCELKKKNYGLCFTCQKQNKINWCKNCEYSTFEKFFSRWSSGNIYIDFVIQETQRNASESTDYLEWIPFGQLDLIEFCGKGTFSTVYSGFWLEGPRWVWDEEGDEWSRNGPIKIAIKRIDYSQNITKEYADKILKYRIQSGSFADCFGMTRDDTGCYAFIMKYYEHNLYQYLDEAKGILCWRDIIDMLWGISEGLEKIHKEGFYHGNLHGGNLLIENEPESVDVRIADIGIHGSVNQTTTRYGVLPFVAPEILKDLPYTQESDIYSFGIIMWTLSSGIKPFCDRAHDKILATEIFNGLRPTIIEGTPQVYQDLMIRCWSSDQKVRPKAAEIYEILCKWVTAICDDPDPSEISNQFDEAEEKKFADLENNKFIIPPVHNQAKYISQALIF
ncbi:hypothetical protein Glove_34g34 [Diversispora epigaea]|uniref:Protein kinase domain-containing protein n=1 Tax=Diversispora epigaea TaxID=1348612 RepID=A0A397JL23_9GLOM|nr:hypothetical protein Glove_34g34 [Diversispora epigaea]